MPGALWSHFKRYIGSGYPNVLVWKAPTRTTVPQRVIEEARERDPAAAASEDEAQFRTDIGAFAGRDALEACVAKSSLIVLHDRKAGEAGRFV